jgi:very-short-patch-repair endonuclease
MAELSASAASLCAVTFDDRETGLPQPLFNPQLILGGRLPAMPDAWWPDRALVVEIDSREWHLSPEFWEATMARDGRLRAVGIRVIHVTPRQVRTEPNWVLGIIAEALRIGEPVPRLITVPAAA